MKNNGLRAYQSPETIQPLVKSLQKYHGKPIKLMEVCGTHTMSIAKYGIRGLLPQSIELVSGPGCPVCVTPSAYIQCAILCSQLEDVIVTTFGDMMRIPFEGDSLLRQKSLGRDIRMIYSPLDNIKIAKENPTKKVIFLSVGFETTTPVIALSLEKAVEEGLTNYMLLVANKTIDEALHVLSSDEEIGINGYLYPGHVSIMIGDSLYHELAKQYNIPGVITGFDPSDILGAILSLSKEINQNGNAVTNLYSRVVEPQGNNKALSLVEKYFKRVNSIWRGIGEIQNSGLQLREEYQQFDAYRLLEGHKITDVEPKGCLCGEILKGKKKPMDCKLYGKKCTPENPVGSCMVSSEGTCAAYYKYCD